MIFDVHHSNHDDASVFLVFPDEICTNSNDAWECIDMLDSAFPEIDRTRFIGCYDGYENAVLITKAP